MYLARFILIASALLLPTLSLLPLGALYLWEKNYLIWWALASLVSVLLITGLQRLLFGKALKTPAIEKTDDAPPDPKWNPLEEEAWSDVRSIAKRANLDQIGDPQAFVDLGLQTVETVARRLHPEKQDALWRFTLPEALAISERVSRELSQYITINVPFGDRMTMAQVWAVYRWRRGFEFAEKAYDIWRILRLANPATAVTNEARDRLSRALVQWGREHVSRRIAETFVQEVGRAAIDLYGGRLKLASAPVKPAAGQTAEQIPIAFLAVIGGIGLHAQEVVADGLAKAQRASSDGAVDGESEAFAHHFSIADFKPLGIPDAAAAVTQIAAADILVWLIRGGSTTEDQAVFQAASSYFSASRDERPPALLRVTFSGGLDVDASDAADIAFPGGVAKDVVIGGAPGRLLTDEQARELTASIHELFPSATRVYNARVVKQLKSQSRRWQTSKQALSAVVNLGKAIGRRAVRRD